MKNVLLIGCIVLVLIASLFTWHPWSPDSASSSNPPAQVAPAMVHVQPGLFVQAQQGSTFDPGAYQPAEAKNVRVVNVPDRVPFRYVLRTSGMDHQLALQGYVEGKQGCRYVNGSVLKCSNAYDGYADLYNPNEAPRGSGGGGSKWASEGASVCEAAVADGGFGGECYDPADEVCGGVARKAMISASGTCPRQLRCCPTKAAVRERTEADDARAPAKPVAAAATASPAAAGAADVVSGETGTPTTRSAK